MYRQTDSNGSVSRGMDAQTANAEECRRGIQHGQICYENEQRHANDTAEKQRAVGTPIGGEYIDDITQHEDVNEWRGGGATS